MTIEQFEKMVEEHDLTYNYSDDHGVWRRGHSQIEAIKAAARQLPREDVERIWNANCDRWFGKKGAKRWYWK